MNSFEETFPGILVKVGERWGSECEEELGEIEIGYWEYDIVGHVQRDVLGNEFSVSGDPVGNDFDASVPAINILTPSTRVPPPSSLP